MVHQIFNKPGDPALSGGTESEKHIRLGLLKMLIQRLEVQPSNVVATDVLPTVGRRLIIKQLRL